jgi:hypothetical protein
MEILGDQTKKIEADLNVNLYEKSKIQDSSSKTLSTAYTEQSKNLSIVISSKSSKTIGKGTPPESPMDDNPTYRLKITSGSYTKSSTSNTGTSSMTSTLIQATSPMDCSKPETIAKNKTLFPSNAPKIFLEDSIKVQTKNELSKDLIEKALKKKIEFSPPKIYVKIIAYRYTKAFNTSKKGDLMNLDDFNGEQKLFEIKADVTKFIDWDYLMYNPDGIAEFLSSKKRYKTLSIYKFVSSVRLKGIKQKLEDMFEDHCDSLDVSMVNDQYVDTIPKEHKGFFFDRKGNARWGRIFLCSFPIISIPWIILEKYNIQNYEAGMVFKITKQSASLMEENLRASMEKEVNSEIVEFADIMTKTKAR